MPDFKKRSTQSELMDDEPVSYAEFAQCLKHLSFINFLTLAYRPTQKWLKENISLHAAQEKISIYDIGSGGGDMMRRLKKRFRHSVDLVGIDINPWSKKYAEEITRPENGIRFETADIFSLRPGRPPDFIISSLFTHHLDDRALVRFIGWMDRHARQGWFINDLHRHPLPYYFIKAVMLLPFNRMVRHDAPVSVARAFTAADWRRLLEQAGIEPGRVDIKWFFPFRYGVACRAI